MDLELNRYIDHRLLKPQATAKDVIKFIKEAEKYQFQAISKSLLCLL